MADAELIAVELREMLVEAVHKIDEVSQRPARLLKEKEAAQYYGVSPGTLRLWRDNGVGPEYIVAEGNSKIIRYDIADLDRYATEHPRRRLTKNEATAKKVKGGEIGLKKMEEDLKSQNA